MPDEPPGWVFEDTDDYTYRSNDYYLVGVTLVEFMHTDCHNCVDQAEVLKEVYADYKGNLSGFFSIGGYGLGGKEDTKEDLKEFKDEYDLTWPVLFDPKGTLMRDYGSNSYPDTFIIKDNQIVEHLTGKHSYDDISEALDKHL